LQAELAQLRAALRTVDAPAPDEAALRIRFREAERRRIEAPAAAPSDAGWRIHFAAAAVVVLAVGAAVGAVVLRVEAPRPAPLAVEPAQAASPPPDGVFQPLSSSPGFAPASAYSVVRVRIPLSAFALVPGTEQDGTVEADLLVGEDGLARAIRFNEADALLVSVAGQ
jgi:hypothetical protein